MQLKALYNLIDGVAPFALSRAVCEKYKMYDNSGILLDCGEDIERVLFSLDLSAAALEEAKRTGANCIVTHHPAIYARLGSLIQDGSGTNVLACARAGISVISAHLNLDLAPDGIDEALMHGLGGKQAIAVMQTVEGGAYGRVYDVEEASFADFLAGVKQNFCTERVLFYGDRPVRRVASFCGAGLDEGAIAFAKANGADTIVSSDEKHHLVADCVEKGLNLVLLTHYSAENYGFTRFAEKIMKSIKGSVFTDGRLL